MQRFLLSRLNVLRDLLRDYQIAVGIPCLDGSLDADFAIAERLGSFRDDFANAQAARRIGRIDSFNLCRALNGAIGQPAFFARHSL